MKITEKQLLIMFRVLEGSLNVHDGGSIFGYSMDERLKIFNQILNQQSHVIVDVGKKESDKD